MRLAIRCPDCGRSYFNEGWHAENCEGPLSGPEVRPDASGSESRPSCRRDYYVAGAFNFRVRCGRPAGHWGACGEGL